jgi:hypothetical protein
VYILQQNFHQYAVSWHFDAKTFAIYSVGCLQIPLVDFMATPASNVMMVQMGEDLRNGRPERILDIWLETTRKLAFVFFPLVGLLIVNAYHLITLLYTSAYVASVPIFMVWSSSILFSIFQTDGVLRTFAQNRYLLIINLTRLSADRRTDEPVFVGAQLDGAGHPHAERDADREGNGDCQNEKPASDQLRASAAMEDAGKRPRDNDDQCGPRPRSQCPPEYALDRAPAHLRHGLRCNLWRLDPLRAER